MKRKQSWIAAALVASAIMMMGAAPQNDVVITADNLSYNGQTGRADGTGNLVITDGDKTMTGASGWYNVRTKAGEVSGGVSVIGTDLAMSADRVQTKNDKEFTAYGKVHLQKDDKQVFGETVTYNTETEFGDVLGNGRVVAEGTTLTGDHIQGWMKEIRAIAQGNVTFANPARQVSGSADQATYTQTPNKQDGVVVLTGNARAIQNGNLINAPVLTIHLDNNSAETSGGRSTLVIVPQ